LTGAWRNEHHEAFQEEMMASSKATTPEQYLEELPPDRRALISALREVVLKHLPAGYREVMGYGMLSYVIPLEHYPNTYNGQPLCYTALAAQKNYAVLYLMGVYADPGETAWLTEAFTRAGKKLDMGKSCLRFKRLEDLPLDVIGQAVARMSPSDFIARYEAARQSAKPAASKGRTTRP
jgi:hypothetical protein